MTDERAYLARHLRSVSLSIMEAGAQICKDIDPLLQPTWPSLLSRLDDASELTVMDASREMGVSHVHVQKILKAMTTAGVVSASADPNDGRRTFYRLTRTGRNLLPKVEDIGAAMLQVIDDIENETGDELYAALSSFKDALARKNWRERVTEKLNMKEALNA
jgi:DNA-binding MarR family transcriptional regulator